MDKETIKIRRGLNELNKGKAEAFQIIETEGDTLHLKGESTGQDISISVVDVFKGVESGTVKLRRKPMPVIKIDGRKLQYQLEYV